MVQREGQRQKMIKGLGQKKNEDRRWSREWMGELRMKIEDNVQIRLNLKYQRRE